LKYINIKKHITFKTYLANEKLVDYYKFLGCFEIDPYSYARNDTEIKYNMDDDHHDPFIEYTDRNRSYNI
jgi:hypothetical protein